jgi:hypothetical protein
MVAAIAFADQSTFASTDHAVFLDADRRMVTLIRVTWLQALFGRNPSVCGHIAHNKP